MRRGFTFIITLTFLLTLAVPASAQGSVTHVVQRGENLYRIALRYGTTVRALASANGLSNPRVIYAGQRLVIPGDGGGAPGGGSRVHVVGRGENLYRIALRYGTTVGALASANGIVNPGHITVGQRLTIPGSGTVPPAPSPAPPSGRVYTVRRGDTLSAIALRYGVSVWALVQANHLRNPSLIYPGQQLRIPDGAANPPPAGGNSGRWIDVDLSAQRVTAYQGDTPVRSTLVSTGLSGTPTLTGRFRIYAKYRATNMSGPGYYLSNVPYTMFYDRGYALHGTYWHSNFGTPMSHGCINMPTAEARWFYSWASVGTLISIHY
jgi:LysM repeat protein